MTYEQIKDYLFIIMEMEKNIYIQGNTLDRLKSISNNLGRKVRILIPKKQEANKVEMSNYIIGGGAFGFIGGFGIKIILEAAAKSGPNRPQGLFQEISSLGESMWAGLIWGIICMVIGCVIGCIIAGGINASNEEEK
ncbi:MAG: hypothetical protein J1E41_03615, partial [Ruminococcus sp.]|nr:hypothetical protein [Ruminococcus sp.]